MDSAFSLASSTARLSSARPSSPTSTASAQPPNRPRANLSLIEQLPPGILARRVGDTLPFSDRCRAVQASKTMRADLEDDSSDPLVGKWYAAKAAGHQERAEWLHRALHRRAQCQLVRRREIEELNNRLTLCGPVGSVSHGFHMGRLAAELVRRARFTDALRVVDALPASVSFLLLRSEICLLAAQACEKPDDATPWYDNAVTAAKAVVGLDSETAFYTQVVARALILKKDYRGALKALDDPRHDPTTTVLTRRLIEHRLDPSLPVVAPPGKHDSFALLEFYAACGEPDQVRLAINNMRENRYGMDIWDRFTSSPFLKSYRESPDGRLLLNSLFLLPEQLATLPLDIELARLPEAAPVAASPQSLPTTGSSSGSASSS